jgi:hypothetical protein
MAQNDQGLIYVSFIYFPPKGRHYKIYRYLFSGEREALQDIPLFIFRLKGDTIRYTAIYFPPKGRHYIRYTPGYRSREKVTAEQSMAKDMETCILGRRIPRSVTRCATQVSKIGRYRGMNSGCVI